MAKRFISTAIWDEDWFLDMPPEYKLFWFYILSNCDFGGLFKVNLRSFCGLNGFNIDPDTALQYFNKNKQRIKVLDNQQVWLIEDFFSFVTLDISFFLNSSKIYIQNSGAKIRKKSERMILFHVFHFQSVK